MELAYKGSGVLRSAAHCDGHFDHNRRRRMNIMWHDLDTHNRMIDEVVVDQSISDCNMLRNAGQERLYAGLL